MACDVENELKCDMRWHVMWHYKWCDHDMSCDLSLDMTGDIMWYVRERERFISSDPLVSTTIILADV